MPTHFDPDEIVRAITEDTRREIRDIGLRVLSAAINLSPVGNPSLWINRGGAPTGYVGGHFRRNWQVGTPIDPTSELPGVGNTSLGEGTAVILSYRRGNVYIVNNVPYANRLDMGHSNQARMGISTPAVAAALMSTGKDRDI